MRGEAVFVGLDVGARKTSVTSSIGQRAVVSSVVGWPKNRTGKTALNGDAVFGEQAVAGESSLHLVRPFADGLLKISDHASSKFSEDDIRAHREAARLLIEYAVSHVTPADGISVFGAISLPLHASDEYKVSLLEACRGTFDAAMVVPSPFAVAYGLNHLHDTILVDIGTETIELCSMFSSHPKPEDRITWHSILRANRSDLTVPLGPACKSITDPIVSGILQLIAKDEQQSQESPLHHVLLSGSDSRLNRLEGKIAEGLAATGARWHVSCVYDRVFAGAKGSLKLAINMPADRWSSLQQVDGTRAAA